MSIRTNNNTCRPTRPVAPYIGGKRNLAKRLVTRIDAIEHVTYAEPFVGMGGVFLKRRRPVPSEIINDLNRDVATLFRILQRHYPQFMDTIKFQIRQGIRIRRRQAFELGPRGDLELIISSSEG